MRFQKQNTSFHPPPQLQPSNISSSSSSSSSSSQSVVELPSKVSSLTHKNHHKQWKSILPMSNGKGKTHAFRNEFDLRTPNENENRRQQIFNRNKTIIQEASPEGSKKLEGCLIGFKCCAFRMCFPDFGKVKPIKTRKFDTKMDYSVNVMSNTFSFSFENFDINAQGRIVRENNNEDDSISSYFELPSTML